MSFNNFYAESKLSSPIVVNRGDDFHQSLEDLLAQLKISSKLSAEIIDTKTDLESMKYALVIKSPNGKEIQLFYKKSSGSTYQIAAYWSSATFMNSVKDIQKKIQSDL